jgi:signal transduction histidine kinase
MLIELMDAKQAPNDGGTVRAASTSADDDMVPIGERRRGRRLDGELKLLAEAGEVLGASLDDAETLRNLARLAVLELADWCVVDVAEDNGRIRRVAVAHRDPERQALVEMLLRYAPAGDRGHVSREAWQAHRASLIDQIDETVLDDVALDDTHRAVLRQLDPGSCMVVPMVARKRLLGVLVLAADRDRRTFDERDLALATELGRRAAVAVDNARLYRVAQDAALARQRVLGIVAHDLRSPLHGVIIAADMLLHYLEDDPNPAHRRSAQAILREASRMNRLIQDLLDVRALDSGGLTVECRSIGAAVIAEDAFSRFRDHAQAAEIDFRLDASANLSHVSADPVRVGQVLSNLIDNALKFTPRGGRVTLAAHACPNGVRFIVSDTGPGIPADQHDRVFAPFWQIQKSDRRGAGLGLSIARGIVAAHGSRIELDSRAGEGATFSFVLPAVTAGESTRPSEESAS